MGAARGGETPAVGRAIRVLVVDDSALMRKVLTAILDSDLEIQVVGAARDPFDAREKIKALSPDVLTLDVEMPRMDGITFLGQLMRLRPMPVVMVSSLTEHSADVTLAALGLGAFDYIPKPKIDVEAGLQGLQQTLIDTVKAAARAPVPSSPRVASPAAAATAKAPAAMLRTTDRLIAIGASTGGTEAIAQVLAELPPDCPGIVIAQHIPEVFSARFAARLDANSALTVCEARDGDQILIGHAYVAPGNRHLRVERSGARYHCRVTSDEPVNRHRPSVDVLFRSVAVQAGANAVGVLLTGMGADGADGLLDMFHAGSPTIAQDQETSVVFGMPKEAIKRGAAIHVLPLPAVAARMLSLATS
jgi:two-component system chemotaxis response regulator CheB